MIRSDHLTLCNASATRIDDAQQEQAARQTEQASIVDTVQQWRGLIDNADFEFRRDVLQALDVRVVYDEDSAGRCV